MSFLLTSSPKNTHILDGEAEDLYAECEAYEDAIKAAGGIDLFLGGIGAGTCAFQNHSDRLIRAIRNPRNVHSG